MRYFITGGAGFIGSTLADRLLESGSKVVVYDNFIAGFEEFLEDAQKSPNFTLIRGDILDPEHLTQSIEKDDFVFHLAANADVRFGTLHPKKDLDCNTIATFNVLEAMRSNGANTIAFSSTGSIYGEPDVFPTPEECPFPIQTSFYGASKLAGEGLIQSYCEGFGFTGYIFRFVSILGERYTHGHVFDFYKKLLADPENLEVLGNGKQRKSYLYIQDCIDAMLTVVEKSADKVNIYNLGTDEYCKVDESIGWICDHLGVSPERRYTGGERGWIGDSPFIFLDCAKVRSLGWKPKLSIREGIIKSLTYLQDHKWVLERR